MMLPPQFHQAVQLFFGLDALEDAGNAQIAAEVDHGLDDGPAGRIVIDLGDEAAVDLDAMQR